MVTIRNETEADYKAVEEITRKAFYNLYVPGCSEHYLVHVMRSHADFVPELDFVLVQDGRVVASILYTKARLVDESGAEKQILTFGPLCVLPECQRKGYGKMLIQHSFDAAVRLGYDTVVIFGSPSNYASSGFKSCQKYHVCLADGSYPAAMMIKELRPDCLDGRKWIYHESPVMQLDEAAAQCFDDALAPMQKAYQPSQEEFYIYSRSVLP